MDAIREQLNKPLVLGIGAFVLGLFIGLVVLGWNLWPVKYTGAGPKDLREDQKAEYLRMAVEAYAQTQNTAVAVARYQALGEGANKVLTDLISNPGSTPLNAIQSYSIAVGAYSPGAGQPQVTPPAGATAQATSATPAKEPAAAPSLLSRLIPILCGIFLLAAIGVLTVFLLKNRGLLNLPTRTAAPAQPAQPAVARQAAYTDYAEQEQPVAQFMASYKAGDDLFDDSFSIDSPAGEFMGECGVSISETIGVGEPKKVSAFEVWLFDKNDIQTVTKVLMSNYAYSDEVTRQRLAAKGEPVFAEPGSEVVLETQTLQLVARVVDMAYGDSALPEDSFFDRFVLQMAVWPKA